MNEADAERILESLVVPALAEDDERKGLPASSFRRYELCSGSYQLEQKARELGQEAHKASAAADRGDRIHAWLAGDTTVQLSESEKQTAEFLLERATAERRRIFGDQEVQVMTEQRLWFKS